MFKIAKTCNHSGRLAFCFNPQYPARSTGNSGDSAIPTLSDSNLAHREIVDLKEGNEIELYIPYVSFSPYLPCDQSYGCLAVYVINELRNPSIASNVIDFNVEVKAAPDMEFAHPIRPKVFPTTQNIRVVAQSGGGGTFEEDQEEALRSLAGPSVPSDGYGVDFLDDREPYNQCSYEYIENWGEPGIIYKRALMPGRSDLIIESYDQLSVQEKKELQRQREIVKTPLLEADKIMSRTTAQQRSQPWLLAEHKKKIAQDEQRRISQHKDTFKNVEFTESFLQDTGTWQGHYLEASQYQDMLDAGSYKLEMRNGMVVIVPDNDDMLSNFYVQRQMVRSTIGVSQSGPMEDTMEECQITALKPIGNSSFSTNTLKFPQLCIGEKINSIKQLISRACFMPVDPTIIGFWPFNVIGGSVYNSGSGVAGNWPSVPNFPTVGNLKTGYGTDYYSLFAPLFAYRRGGVVIRLLTDPSVVANQLALCSDPTGADASSGTVRVSPNSPSILEYGSNNMVSTYVPFYCSSHGFLTGNDQVANVGSNAAIYPYRPSQVLLKRNPNTAGNAGYNAVVLRSAADDTQFGYFLGVPELQNPDIDTISNAI